MLKIQQISTRCKKPFGSSVSDAAAIDSPKKNILKKSYLTRKINYREVGERRVYAVLLKIPFLSFSRPYRVDSSLSYLPIINFRVGAKVIFML